MNACLPPSTTLRTRAAGSGGTLIRRSRLLASPLVSLLVSLAAC